MTGIFVEQGPERYASLCPVLDEIDPDRTVPRIVEPGDLGTLLHKLIPVADGAAHPYIGMQPM